MTHRWKKRFKIKRKKELKKRFYKMALASQSIGWLSFGPPYYIFASSFIKVSKVLYLTRYTLNNGPLFLIKNNNDYTSYLTIMGDMFFMEKYIEKINKLKAFF